MEEFPSGQRGQTVNLLRFASVVRIHPPPPRRSKVRFAPTSFYACGKKRRHPPASLLLLSKPNPLRWASVWCRRFAAILFHHNKLLIFDLSSCSLQASYRLRRAFYFITKFIARSFCCSSLPNWTRCRWAPVWRRRFAAVHTFKRAEIISVGTAFLPGKVRFATTSFYAYSKKDVIRPLPCSSFPNRTRSAGLRFGAAASRRFYSITINY